MKKLLLLLLSGYISVVFVFAQETEMSETEKLNQRVSSLEDITNELKKLKVSGYFQTQYQWGEENATLKVGTANENPEKEFNRIGIRRGRIKFTYDANSFSSAVFQLDITEKGISFRDAYFNVKDPWLNSLQLRAGIFDRPFGHEIGYSSSRRESPERSILFQTLFPEERDLGAMLILQAPKTSALSIIKFEGGLFAGNGIKPETDNKKDFIGHLSLSKTFENFSFAFGGSYYSGSVYQGSNAVFKMEGDKFVKDENENNKGAFAHREYFGGDIQLTAFTFFGMSQLRAEYIQGQQPGSVNSSKSPNWSTLPTHDTYIRPFSGWYATFVQDLGASISAVAKYDIYNPNTKVSGNEVGKNGTSKTDLSVNTLGFGLIWKMSSALKLTGYYEFVKNEVSENVAGYEKVLKADVFTLRLQYKF